MDKKRNPVVYRIPAFMCDKVIRGNDARHALYLALVVHMHFTKDCHKP